MPRTVKKLLHSWAFKRKKQRPKAWDIVLPALMWVVWRERNNRAFEALENDFVHVRSSIMSLVSLWCTHEVFVCYY